MCGHHYFSKKPVSYNSYVYLCIQRNEERSMSNIKVIGKKQPNIKKRFHCVLIGHKRNRLFCEKVLSLTDLIVDRAADDVEKFGRNSLLTTLVVLEVQFAKQLVGIVRSGLHGHHTGGMLRGIGIEQGRVEHQMGHLRQELREDGVHVGLDDEVVVERLHFLPLTSLLLPLTSLLQILLRLLRGDDAGQVALVVGIQLRLDVDGQEGLMGKNL